MQRQASMRTGRFAALALLITAGTTLADVKLTTGIINLPTLTRAQVTQTLQSLATADAQHVVMQFDGPLSEADRDALAMSGVALTGYLGQHAFIATLSDTNVRATADVRSLQSVAAFSPAYKMHHLLQSGDLPAYAIVGDAGTDDPRIAVYALFHRDADLEAGSQLVESLGGEIIDTLESVNGVVAHLGQSAVEVLAAQDAVLYIEPPLPQFDMTNDSNRIITQANDVQAAPYGLDGSGVTVLVYDGGTARSTHVDFEGRASSLDGSGQHYHSTHVAGTIGGAGVANAAYKGMAPGVQIRSYGFQYDGSGIFLYSNPGDIESDYDEAMNTYGANIANNSIGTNTATNGFPCDITGDYGVTSNLIDTIVRGSLGDPYLIFWANGNERQTSNCGSTYYTTAPPACAKNHITVGALNSNDDSVTSFTSWGPADDGRLKPDISTAGCQSNSDGGVTSCDSSSNTAYTTLCGTSMASPTACGIGALLLEDYRDLFPGAPDFRNSTMKILLAHTANDGGNTGPDMKYGYGSIRAKDAVDFLRRRSFREESVSNGGQFGFTLDVAPGDPELKVTIAWDDYPAVPLASNALVNDLDLVVTSPSGTRYYPWTLDPANPGNPAVKTQEDHINNIEQVQVNNPEAGTWTVQIIGTNVPEGPQIVSMCSTPDLLVEGLFANLVSDVPDYLDPNIALDVTMEAVALGETIVPGSATLYYRTGPGGFTSVAMSDLGNDEFQATMPGVGCADTPEFYCSIEGTQSGLVFVPVGAPANTYSYGVGHFETTLAYDMEANDGWTAGAPDDDATTGAWGRMDPQGTDAQPEDDHTAAPGTDCWVTDGRSGNSVGDYDIDNGKTTLFSAVMDLTDQEDSIVSYWRWYNNVAGADPNNDIFVIDISTDGGGTFPTNVETVGPSGPGTGGGWMYHEFRVGDKITPTTQVQLRFVASDESSGSIVEAAIDDFRITAFVCDDGNDCLGDFNGDGQRDQADLGHLLGAYGVDDGGDIDGDGDTDQADLGALLGVYGVPCP